MTTERAAWIAGAVVAVLLLLTWQGVQRDRAVAYEARAQAALVEAGMERLRADSIAAAAAARVRAAEAYAARSDSLRAVADARAAVTRQRIATLPPAPPEAEEHTAPRDSIIAALLTETEELRDALDTERRGAEALRGAYERERSARLAVEASHDRLRVTLEQRPRPRSPLIPQIVVGPQAGVGTSGTYTGVGVTLGWTIKL